MRGLHEVVPEPLPLFDRGADLLSADELDGDVGPPQGGVLGEQRGEAVEVAHCRCVGVLAAQRLDLEAVDDGLKSLIGFLPGLCCGLCTTGGPLDRKSRGSVPDRR
jgi:hypothetical protein